MRELRHTPRALRFSLAAGALPPPARFVDEARMPFAEGGGPFTLEGEELGLDGTRLLRVRLDDKEQPTVTLRGPDHSRLFGFGAASDAFDRVNQRFRLFTLDTLFFEIEGASYTSFPFLWFQRPSGDVVAVLLHTTLPIAVQTKTNEAELVVQSGGEPDPLELYVFTGSPLEVLDDYTRLTGRPFLPPAWSLGYHQCRWSYKTQRKVLDVGRRFRVEDFPCDAVWLDIHYMDNFRVFTWDPKAFPRPKALHEELAKEGLRTVAIVDPGVSRADYAAYLEGKASDAYMKTSRGEDFVGRVWPGATVFPDFTKDSTRAFWARQHRALFEAGVEGIWNDMNDPVLRVGKRYDPLAEDLVHAEGSHRRFRNLYGNLQAGATLDAFAQHRPEVRPFVLTRSGMCGIQKSAAVWTGDNYSSWDQLKANLHQVLNLGLSGVPMSGADIGGFGGRKGRLGVFKHRVPMELFVRWMELGAFMPFCRTHTVLYSPAQEPWSYGSRALAACRRVMRRRYQLLPYLCMLGREAHERGTPFVRPLFFHHKSPPADACHDQFLLGRDLLLAPVLDKGTTAREVWLPEGGWIDFDTGERLKGGARVHRSVPLGRPLLFVREGAVIPMAEPMRNADDTLAGRLVLEVFAAGGDVDLEGRVVLDDGRTRAAAEQGAYFDLRLHGTLRAGELELRLERSHDGYRPTHDSFELRVRSSLEAVAVVEGSAAVHPVSLDDEDRRGSASSFAVGFRAERVSARLGGRES
jgi:alpha-glucosidase